MRKNNGVELSAFGQVANMTDLIMSHDQSLYKVKVGVGCQNIMGYRRLWVKELFVTA